jgi:DNA-binding response OmpR family regulator
MLFSRRSKARKPACITHLLVVEDDPIVAFDHELDLQHAGYSVTATVNSGEAAVAVLAEDRVDAVVLDLYIDGAVSGHDVARLAHDRGIAVLLVSGEDAGSAAAHAFGLLAKPLAKGSLVAALRAMEAQLCRGEAPRDVSGLIIFAPTPARL